MAVYFCAASLPYLTFNSDKAISFEEFFDFCDLAGIDRTIVQMARLLPMDDAHSDYIDPKVHPTIYSYWKFERGLRNTLAKLRANRMNKDSSTQVRLNAQGDDCTAIAGLNEGIRSILNNEDPLKTEKELDRFRWEYLDELEQGHYFDLEFVVLYYLRLQILHRQLSFSPEYADSTFQEQFKMVLQNYTIQF